jgi:hypothetical protein
MSSLSANYWYRKNPNTIKYARGVPTLKIFICCKVKMFYDTKIPQEKLVNAYTHTHIHTHTQSKFHPIWIEIIILLKS